ncbi:NAD-dependent protein deacylase SRT2 [Selaginella moellendorffii]|uniref:NAD-dependent protein deacylase SRT2 n=1 Tax=Selaginella moellendorffii TaxID=88036 RepID=UPI000D1C82C5|nr:NAD-dependent protein deacylase SRT2 [Selaginella moellendorffii]|eukprot:XP_024539153.1 NAD-dependent protein deacylase SRT2 [Selaginella moellendorffii]
MQRFWAMAPATRFQLPRQDFPSRLWFLPFKSRCLSTRTEVVRFKTPGDRNLIPHSAPPTSRDYELLSNFLQNSKKLTVITGAGVSTESGIPDYRGPQGAYSTGFKPITHQEFLKSAYSRRRYWARSYIGWRRFSQTQPGPSHIALAKLEGDDARTTGMITQNVDRLIQYFHEISRSIDDLPLFFLVSPHRLHHKAGSNPIELHGTTHQVVCLSCGDLSPRQTFQDRLKLLNLEWAAAVEIVESGGVVGSDVSFGMQQRPDGDIEIDDSVFSRDDFQIPACQACGGNLKPHVVFFGDNVPLDRARAAASMVQESDALLIVGSSVMVLSAFRLVSAAHKQGSPIAVINVGKTRADEIASFKIESCAGEVLSGFLSTQTLKGKM